MSEIVSDKNLKEVLHIIQNLNGVISKQSDAIKDAIRTIRILKNELENLKEEKKRNG